MNNNNLLKCTECLKRLKHDMYITEGHEMYWKISDILELMYFHIIGHANMEEFYDFFDDFCNYVRCYETIKIENKRDEFFRDCAMQVCNYLDGKNILFDQILKRYSEWKHEEYLEDYYAPTGIKWRNTWCNNCIESMYRQNFQCYERGGSIYIPKESLPKDSNGNIVCRAFIPIPEPISFKDIDFDCENENVCAICGEKIEKHQDVLIYRTNINILYQYLHGVVDYCVHNACLNSDNGTQVLNNKIIKAVQNANDKQINYLRKMHDKTR